MRSLVVSRRDEKIREGSDDPVRLTINTIFVPFSTPYYVPTYTQLQTCKRSYAAGSAGSTVPREVV